MIHLHSSVLLAATPVVDIDGTLWVQGGIFIFLMMILHPLLFRPWLEVQQRRQDSIEGALVKSECLRAEADKLLHLYEQRLDNTRDEAAKVRSHARREVEAEQSKSLEQLRSETGAELERERQRLAREAEQARQSLSTRIDELAQQITTKILGRAP